MRKASMNKVILVGNLGQDPDMRYTPQGTPVTTFRMALNERWADRSTGETQERTDWIGIECWNKLAETVNTYLTKGSHVLVEGRLRIDTWEDQKTGQRQSRMFVRADSVQFLDPPDSHDQNRQPARQASRQPVRQPADDMTEDDIPF
jgi:single-strand DNA-binding protein